MTKESISQREIKPLAKLLEKTEQPAGESQVAETFAASQPQVGIESHSKKESGLSNTSSKVFKNPVLHENLRRKSESATEELQSLNAPGVA